MNSILFSLGEMGNKLTKQFNCHVELYTLSSLDITFRDVSFQGFPPFQELFCIFHPVQKNKEKNCILKTIFRIFLSK